MNAGVSPDAQTHILHVACTNWYIHTKYNICIHKHASICTKCFTFL